MTNYAKTDHNMRLMCVMLCYDTCYVMLGDVIGYMFCYVMLSSAHLCYVNYGMLCYVAYVMLSYVMLCYVMLCYVMMLCYVRLC